MKILFVCTGNTCRSPMAEAVFNRAAAERGADITAVSAGVMARFGDRASANAKLAAAGLGLSLENHCAKNADRPMIDGADLILAMTASHKAAILAQFPDSAAKIHTIGEFTGDYADVPDPFGQDLSAYETCCRGLAERAEKILCKLTAKNGQSGGIIALGSDGAGFHLKTVVVKYLEDENIPYKDFGAYDDGPSDYPDFAKAVSRAILNGECARGILICGTGIGISIAANRHAGIRAALCHDVFSARATRLHNDANVLAMGGRVIGDGPAQEIVKAFLETGFSHAERHVNRIKKIEE